MNDPLVMDLGRPVVTDGIKGWAIRFVPHGEPGAIILAEFTDPDHRFAVAVPVSPEDLLVPTPGAAPTDELRVFCLPEGVATVERWRPAPPAIEVTVPAGTILWRPGQAALHGPPERVEGLLSVLVEFAFYEGELRRLEREVAADWPMAEADVALTHRLGPSAIRRWDHVSEMTRRVTWRRMRYARLQPRLEPPAGAVAGPAKRVLSELLARADVERRLQTVDDRLEICEDIYERANERISEYRYFRVEAVIEIVVAFLLLVEIVIMVWDVWFTHIHGPVV